MLVRGQKSSKHTPVHLQFPELHVYVRSVLLVVRTVTSWVKAEGVSTGADP